jgi:hypothetical protein
MDDETKRLLWGLFFLAYAAIHISLTIGVIMAVVKIFAMYTKDIPPDPSLGLYESLKALVMAVGAYVMGRKIRPALAAYLGIKHEP